MCFVCFISAIIFSFLDRYGSKRYQVEATTSSSLTVRLIWYTGGTYMLYAIIKPDVCVHPRSIAEAFVKNILQGRDTVRMVLDSKHIRYEYSLS